MHQSSAADVMDLTKVSSTFPEMPEPLIMRENIIQAIKDMLSADSEVVFIDGPEGIGKNTLLSLFAKNHPQNSFSLFISGSSRFTYDSSVLLADLSDQINWVLKKERFRLDLQEEPSQLLYSRIVELQRQANHERKTYYFVIDGLHEIPEGGAHELGIILNSLPFGVGRFRFIISGTPALLNDKIGKLRGVSPFRMIGFSMEDTERFFGELLPEKHYLTSVHQISKMLPGNMASLRRLLQGGMPYTDLLANISKNPPDWFQLEWAIVDRSASALKKALATLAFYRSKISKESLSELSGCAVELLEDALSKFTFIHVSDEGLIDFVCEAFRRIASEKLSNIRKVTLEAITSHLLQAPHSKEALTNLPTILHQAGKHEDLISYLSPENIEHLIKISDSWVPMHQKIELAVASALKLGNDSDLLRFSIQNSALTTLESADPWRSEISAYVALDDYSAVSALAQQMPTKEDRLQLLAVIAKSRKNKSLPPDAAINEQISSLYEMIDCQSLGRRGIEIAADLVYTHPGMAVELVQACSGPKSQAPGPDIVFARMSINALLEKSEGMESTHQDLRSKIKDPSIQRYIDTASMHFGSYSADAVIVEVSGWEKPADRIAALEGWASVNKNTKDASRVISFALDTILKTTTYTANARVYYHLVRPLPLIEDLEFVRSIVVRVDGLKGPIEQAGPTTEFVKLQGILAEAEGKYNRISAFYRCQDIYYYVDKIQDYSTRMASFAILVAALKRIDPDLNFVVQGPILDLALDGLHSSAEAILSKTADHFEAILPAIGILATTQPDLAFDIIGKVNTIRRQDRALVEFIRSLCKEALSEDGLRLIDDARGKIVYRSSISLATVTVVESVFRIKKSWDVFTPGLGRYCEQVRAIDDAAVRCRLYSILASIAAASSVIPSVAILDTIKARIIENWESITTGWSRVDAGFNASSLLAADYPELARDLLNRTEKIRGEIVLDSDDSATCYIACVRLAIRSFSGLIRQKAFTQRDIDSLSDLIDRIPCKINQVAGWSEMAIRLYLNGDSVVSGNIVSTKIKPALERCFTKDAESQFAATASAAPALYCAHAQSALNLIKELPPLYADRSLVAICNLIVCKKNPFEDYDSRSKAREIATYENFLDVCAIMELFDSDYNLFWAVEILVDGIGSKKFRSQFSRAQIADVKDRITRICDRKLPNARFIKHEGYRILIEAQLLKLYGERSGWSDLVDRARALPNFADATLVVIGVAENMPSREKVRILEIFNEAKSRIPDIPFFEDRVHHYEALAESGVHVDKEFGKECIRMAWAEALPLPTTDLPRVRRRLIDFAHRVDPDFAAGLASETTDDPGRDFARQEAKMRLNLMKAREELASGDTVAASDSKRPDDLVQLAQMMLSGLNSGRVTSMHVSKIREFLEKSSKLDISGAYFVLSWIVENAVLRFSGQGNVVTSVKPLFEASKLSAELSYRVAARIRAVADSGIFAARASDLENSLVKPGDRDLALEKIAEWASGAKEFIKITDPYFGIEELEIVKVIRSGNPEIPIRILTSRSHQLTAGVSQPWDDAYQAYWRISVSDADPGPVTITVIGEGASGSHPIHDRWFLSRNSGLRIGTSLNSLGETRSSEVSIIEGHEIDALLAEFDRCLRDAMLSSSGERVKRVSFEL